MMEHRKSKEPLRLGEGKGVVHSSPPGAASQAAVPLAAADKVTFFHGPGDSPATTTFSDGGGKRLNNCKVHLVFWGAAWRTSVPSLQSIANDAAKVLRGPYLDRLAQYGVGLPPHLGSVLLVPDALPDTFDLIATMGFINSLIDRHLILDPDHEQGDSLPVVFAPPGVRSPPPLVGEHGYAFRGLFERVPFAFVTDGGGTQAEAAYSISFSHELVEALSDPFGDGIQTDPRGIFDWQEIGDACRSPAAVNGVIVQSYWSGQDAACAVPTRAVHTLVVSGVRFDNKTPPGVASLQGKDLTDGFDFDSTEAELIDAIDRGHLVQIHVLGNRLASIGVRVVLPSNGFAVERALAFPLGSMTPPPARVANST